MCESFAFPSDGSHLPARELSEALSADNHAKLFIAGRVDHVTQTITFWRGDLTPIAIPMSAFPVSGDGTAPDFHRLAVIDCGQTIRLGDYEAAVDALVEEYDSTENGTN